MAKFRLHRRALIKGAGGIAIALPWMEIMGRPKRARRLGEDPLGRMSGLAKQAQHSLEGGADRQSDGKHRRLVMP